MAGSINCSLEDPQHVSHIQPRPFLGSSRRRDVDARKSSVPHLIPLRSSTKLMPSSYGLCIIRTLWQSDMLQLELKALVQQLYQVNNEGSIIGLGLM